MRTKTFILLLTCFVITSSILILFSNQRPTIQNIVSETHKQLNNLKTLKENLQDVLQEQLTADPEVLELLGFVKHPRIYPNDSWTNITLPPIVTAASSGEGIKALGFVKNVHHFVPGYHILLYDLGLGRSESETLLEVCNGTRKSSHCSIVKFPYKQFPSHVKTLKFHTFRPLIIQQVLNDVGAILWMDVDYRLVTDHLEPFVKIAKKVGLVAWGNLLPTSAVTHPNMFHFFQTSQELFFFHHLVETSVLVLFNIQLIHSQLMLPWVQCALTPACIAPIGAQSYGCRFDKKPQFRYSGCHWYDASAFNIILGVVFGFDSSSYMGQKTFFRKLGEDWEYYDSFNETSGGYLHYEV
ncbi:unnamed protein product [Darwinula stevensoni]|uniref:Uncharacterized protein n=1 Tax=Darwinula stevensoni TaxID=69355 RepID=A0A7R9FQ82_9CRUS|nr:unnamed protein product [Darwinula stevensoni]CAG0899227.1 unnamed protein product [Darwinula stevensoni]